MHHLSVKRAARLLLSAGLLLSMAAPAVADTLVADPATDPTNPVEVEASNTFDVSVTLVATDDDNPSGCNLTNPNNHFVEAEVESQDTSVATVSPASLTFTACGQTKSFTITGVGEGETTVTITAVKWDSAGGPNAKFSSDVVHVKVTAGDDDDDDDDGGGIIVCDKPAAPAWAAHILKAGSKAKKPAKDQPNYVAEVAKEMTEGATFMGIAKSDQEDYAQAVLDYLKEKTGDQSLSLPEGWPPHECETNGDNGTA